MINAAESRWARIEQPAVADGVHDRYTQSRSSHGFEVFLKSDGCIVRRPFHDKLVTNQKIEKISDIGSQSILSVGS